MFETSYHPPDRTPPMVPTTVGSLLEEAAAAAPDHIGLVMGRQEPTERLRRTYAELLNRARAGARALLSHFEVGTRLAIWAPNISQFFDVEFAAALAGMTLVPLNPSFGVAEARHPLGQTKAAGIFYWREHRGNPIDRHVPELLADLPTLRSATRLEEWDAFVAGADHSLELPLVDPTSAAQIQFTSGTTGTPKGVVFHHLGMTNMARFACQRLQMGSETVWINPNPLFHASGCAMSTVGPLILHATHVCLEQFSPALLLELIESEHGSMTGGVPTMLITMMEHPDFHQRDLSSLRTVMSGGSVVPPELVRKIEKRFGAHFAVAFGQTETLGNVTQTHLDDSPEDKAETIGRPLPHTEIKIIPIGVEGGDVVPVGTAGELCVRGPMIMKEYLDQPELTRATIDPDGWLHTGDICTMDSRGYFRVAGRLKDLIIRGGENIAAREVEDVLYTHPAVAEVAVVGIPDATWGEEILAVVRLVGGTTASPEDLEAHVRQSLAPFKTPRYWRFVETFPVSAGGKIQKHVLRDEAVANVES